MGYNIIEQLSYDENNTFVHKIKRINDLGGLQIEDYKMRINKEFVLREIAGDYVIIPTGQTVLEFNGLITVNEVGVSLWNMLQKEVTEDDLVKGILEEYEVEEDVAREDIREFIDTLVTGNILAKEESNEE